MYLRWQVDSVIEIYPSYNEIPSFTPAVQLKKFLHLQ